MHARDELEGPSARVSSIAPARREATPVDKMLELQRLVGNATVSRLVSAGEGDAVVDEVGRSPVLDVVRRGGGEPLEPGLRAEMEAGLGADLREVRIHRDAAASGSASSIRANAYTVGSDVVFRSDQWSPGTEEGKRTLAHELAHVVQQAAGPVNGAPAPGGIRLSDPGDDFERAADRAADSALAQRQSVDGEEEEEQEEEKPSGR